MSMALKYGMNKRKKMADGGEIKSPSGDDFGPAQPPTELAGINAKSRGRTRMAHGGLVERVMSKRSGSTGPKGADPTEDDFDLLDEVDDLDSSYTGADSGDELGDKIPDESLDVVSRAMRKRKK